MFKKFLLACLLSITIFSAEVEDLPEDLNDMNLDEEDWDDEQFDEKISEIDSTEFVQAIEDYFDKTSKNEIDLEEATHVTLKIYSDSTMEEIANLDESKKLEDMTETEENLIYFKGHLMNYFADNYKGGTLTRDQLVEVVKTNKILEYLEQKMMEDDMTEMEMDEDRELPDGDFDDEDLGDDEDAED